MKKIPTENIQPGQVLAREVCGPSGNILLGKGLELTPAIGRRLKNWEIHFVFVEGEQESMEDASPEGISPEILKSELMHKFSDVINNPIMKKIFAAAYQHRINRNSKWE
ncbi:hypothetical protein CHISP_1382 [Chitinispirillum alkaliphilum]|nr:hypothetical protein CHISP_1382 [Chitinispirillum alkaliphilum]